MMPELPPLLVATIASIVVGVVWYSPGLFGTVWAREVGSREGDTRDGMIKAILQGALQNFAMVYVLSVMLRAEGIGTPVTITYFTLALISLSHLGAVIWEKRSMTYYLITTGYLVVSLSAAAFIIRAWPWA